MIDNKAKPTIEPTVESVEEELIITGRLKEEASQIPINKVSEVEGNLIIRYLNDKPLTADDLDQLKALLERFRPAIQKYDPQGTIENIKHNETIILDEKEFLKMDENFNNIVTIPFSYPQGNNVRRMHFDVYPITDSQAVLDIQNNLSMFKDLTENEATVYQKMQNGDTLSREELIIKESVEEKINRETQKNQKQIIVEFLAMQCKFAGKDSSYENMKQVFSRIPLFYLALLFQKVQKIGGISSINADTVFQEFSN